MTRVLVIGASGMLGHRLVRGLSSQHEVIGTVRGDAGAYSRSPHFAAANLVGSADANDIERIADIARDLKPNVVVNAVGAIKQISDGQSPIAAIRLNALLPHQLAQLSGRIGARLISFSTDCVFSGRKGPYTEMDPPDPMDVYGRSKLLGEVDSAGCITLRTSFIGRELRGRHSLIEWFLAQTGTIKGFRKALYTGLTTATACDVVDSVIRNHSNLSGVWQVAGPAISKYELLEQTRQAFGVDVRIEPDDTFICDRRLDGTHFAEETGIRAPSWPEMLARLVEESRLYDWGLAKPASR